MRILLIYHFFHPDIVISARLFSELAEDLARAGHEVTVFTSNRCIRADGELPEAEAWRGVRIRRFARPDFRQGSNVGRVMNSLILQRKWIREFKGRREEFDALVVGTDPQFCWLMFPRLKRLAPKARLVHWVFDLYPEALAATGSRLMGVAASFMRPLARRAYRNIDVMADIGGCMRSRLREYGHHASETTLTPWALAEPETIPEPDTDIRRQLFGDAKIGFLYSGTVGHAHDIAPFIELARECRRRGLSIGFCFAGYGNRYAGQTAQITADDTNIRLAGFASEEELERRLAAADFHLISLREGWEGIVVPSKFFGALAIGRPVLFSGSRDSEIAKWIEEFGLGYILSNGTMDVMEGMLESPQTLAEMRRKAFDAYHAHFSRRVVTGKWLEALAHASEAAQNKP